MSICFKVPCSESELRLLPPKPSAWTEAEITRLKSICAESPKIPTCYIANEIGKPCFEVIPMFPTLPPLLFSPSG